MWMQIKSQSVPTDSDSLSFKYSLLWFSTGNTVTVNVKHKDMNCFMAKGVSFSLSATQGLTMTQPIRLGDRVYVTVTIVTTMKMQK